MILYNLEYYSLSNKYTPILFWFSIILCITLILCRGILKIINPFWFIQPIFHYYNVYYWLFPNKIINKNPPKLNKYVDTQNVKVINIYDANQNILQSLCNFIKNNYLQSSISKYNPGYSHIVDYLYGSNHPSYICIHRNPFSSDITGATTTRVLDVKLPNNTNMPTYYVDHLCVSKHFRKKKIAPKLIQTFYYLVSRLNKNVNTYFFKREGKLMNVVPLTKYITYGYKSDTITSLYNNQYHRLHSQQIQQINEKNAMDIWHFIKKIQLNYKISIIPCFTMFKNIIKHKLYNVYIRKEGNLIHDVYIIKDCATTYYDEPCIEVIASISGKNKEAYIQGFIKSISLACNMLSAKNVFIENIGDTTQFIDYLKLHRSIKSIFTQSPTAYYFYNYAIRSIHSKHCFILS